jgi:chorismate mutase
LAGHEEETGRAMRVRGIRGATTVQSNTREAILSATTELLEKMIELNEIDVDEIASAVFSTSPDLNAEFPAVAARLSLGWHHTALSCMHEMNVPGSLPMCLRVMLHVNMEKRQDEVVHVYMRGARVLRPDRALTPEK